MYFSKLFKSARWYQKSREYNRGTNTSQMDIPTINVNLNFTLKTKQDFNNNRI